MGYAKLIIEALTAIPKIFDGINGIASKIEDLIESITERNIQKLKDQVTEKLDLIAKTKNNKDRQKLIEELNELLSK
jgi:hypothetical protein